MPLPPIDNPRMLLEQDPGWGTALIAVGLVLAAVAVVSVVLARRRRGWKRWLAAAVAGAALLVDVPWWLGIGGYFWFYHRPAPRPIERQPLFQGVWYSREVRDDPPLVVHIVEVDLNAPGGEFFVTPPLPQEGHETTAMTTGEFLERYDLQIAVNAGPFNPSYVHSPWSYYPKSGDPVDLYDLVIAQGETVSPGDGPRDYRATFAVDEEGTASIGYDEGAWQAVTGWSLDPEVDFSEPDSVRSPRTALALGYDRNRLILLVADGYRPGTSIGATRAEVMEILMRYGGDAFVNLDGGDSSTLVAAGHNGRARLLNMPVFSGVPGRQAPVGSHLGIRARPLE